MRDLSKQFDLMITQPLNSEAKNPNFDKDLVSKFISAVEASKNFKTKENQLKNFTEIFESQKFDFKDLPKDVIKDQMKSALDECFNLF